MSNANIESGHWTDQQFIDHLYGLGSAGNHLNECVSCAARLAAFEQRRSLAASAETVSDEFLAAQRRAIYARLSEPRRWWREIRAVRWAPVAAILLMLAGSFGLYEQRQLAELAENRRDAQLAQEVANMSLDTESGATAPLHGIFVE